MTSHVSTSAQESIAASRRPSSWPRPSVTTSRWAIRRGSRATCARAASSHAAYPPVPPADAAPPSGSSRSASKRPMFRLMPSAYAQTSPASYG
ncbi:hypothetical protein AA958_09915 [Streptomyces sp. CNQ-509]|uniref:hypothetical protein n=1 Tax=Streptomyces sp. CNQ-509 TaxID=444103 RepID=UPI00062DF5AB|nr:hypothetical protein [Streptomyces sp. CNQ-509]AKH82498.1 hypothetical protein AA958_09915 [Streptomyces sp. CNQ-509]